MENPWKTPSKWSTNVDFPYYVRLPSNSVNLTIAVFHRCVLRYLQKQAKEMVVETVQLRGCGQASCNKGGNHTFAYWCLAGNEGMIHFITSNNHPSNPQQPIHSLRLAPVPAFCLAQLDHASAALFIGHCQLWTAKKLELAGTSGPTFSWKKPSF